MIDEIIIDQQNNNININISVLIMNNFLYSAGLLVNMFITQFIKYIAIVQSLTIQRLCYYDIISLARKWKWMCATNK